MDSAPRRNLSLVKELGDRAAQGRAYGNLGNTHYLLGSFVEAITFHKEVSGWTVGRAAAGTAPVSAPCSVWAWCLGSPGCSSRHIDTGRPPWVGRRHLPSLSGYGAAP